MKQQIKEVASSETKRLADCHQGKHRQNENIVSEVKKLSQNSSDSAGVFTVYDEWKHTGAVQTTSIHIPSTHRCEKQCRDLGSRSIGRATSQKMSSNSTTECSPNPLTIFKGMPLNRTVGESQTRNVGSRHMLPCRLHEYCRVTLRIADTMLQEDKLSAAHRRAQNGSFY